MRVEFVTDGTAVLWPGSKSELGDLSEREYEHEHELRQLLIERGFRARLANQSLITGKLMVELGFFPDTEINLRGNIDNEIPTIPTTIERMWEELGKVDLAGIAEGIETLINGLNEIVNNNNLKEIEQETLAALQSINRIAADMNILVTNLNERIDGIADSFEFASNEVGKLAMNINEQVTPLSGDLRTILNSMDQSLQAAQKTLKLANDALAKDSPLQIEAVKTLKSISEAARSFKGFTDYLERHPEALISGKR